MSTRTFRNGLGDMPRVALVTGAGRRIGRACALALARDGYDLVLHYLKSRRETGLLGRRIRELGRRAWLVQGDLSRPEVAVQVFAAAVHEAGPIGLLVNNASMYEGERGGKMRAEQLGRHLRLHALSPLILTCCLAAQKCAGAVINLLDARLGRHDPRREAYIRSKRMLYALTKMMAVEVAPRVRVNGIAPGAILPPAGGASDACLRRMARANLLKRMGKPEDIAGAVVYLAGARFVTGQVLYVDGGYREARSAEGEDVGRRRRKGNAAATRMTRTGHS